MTLYAVWASDSDGQFAMRERVRPAHRARLREPGEHPVKVVLAGPTLDGDGGAMNGTLLVVDAASLEAVRAFVADDPYVHAGVYAQVDIRPWRCGLGPLADTAPPPLPAPSPLKSSALPSAKWPIKTGPRPLPPICAVSWLSKWKLTLKDG